MTTFTPSFKREQPYLIQKSGHSRTFTLISIILGKETLNNHLLFIHANTKAWVIIHSVHDLKLRASVVKFDEFDQEVDRFEVMVSYETFQWMTQGKDSRI